MHIGLLGFNAQLASIVVYQIISCNKWVIMGFVFQIIIIKITNKQQNALVGKFVNIMECLQRKFTKRV